MKGLLSLFALVLALCNTAMAQDLTTESPVGTIGTLDGREAMVVDLGGSIGKVAVALENVGATSEDAFGTRFSTTSGATNFYDPETYNLENRWYVPSQDELSALKSLLVWESDNSAVYYENYSDLQFPLRPSGQSYYGDYITSTTSVSGTYTDYAYLYIAYAYNPGEGSGIPSISMSEGHNQSDFSNRTTLTAVIWPSAVTSIGDKAFVGCTNVTSVTFSGIVVHGNESLSSIGTVESPANLKIPSIWLANDKPVNSATPWHGGYFNCEYVDPVKEFLGSLGTKQDGPAVEVIDQDDKVLKLYNPKQVNFIKVKVEE